MSAPPRQEEPPQERPRACRALLLTLVALALGCAFSGLLVHQVIWPALRETWEELHAP
ncbi:MAG: hypothetical protein M9894_08005 [Planctomycetes bacterium]|nr:hypothetical protein [Planctomycetota bacterium]